jgi:tetratricopeptide (TPR) repeat protein
MTTSNGEGSLFLQNNQSLYHEQIAKITQPILPQFDHLIQRYVLFNFLFIMAGVTEIVCLLIFFTLLTQSSLAAFALSLIFLTFFSYFIFRIYFQTAKPEQLESLKNQYINNFKTIMSYQEGVPEHHAAIALSCSKLSDQLAGKELSYYSPPRWLAILSPLLEKFSFWWHWQDVLLMRELLLKASISEHVKLVRSEPTNLELHAVLANAYVLLSSLYADQKKQFDKEGENWNLFKSHSLALDAKFRITAQKAVEELKILNEFAPNDPWVHLQLAYSYHDLGMNLEEINEYEIILKLNPDDLETLYKLGFLYFQEGMNAKGLRVYEMLKQKHYKKTESLLKYYG